MDAINEEIETMRDEMADITGLGDKIKIDHHATYGLHFRVFDKKGLSKIQEAAGKKFKLLVPLTRQDK